MPNREWKFNYHGSQVMNLFLACVIPASDSQSVINGSGFHDDGIMKIEIFRVRDSGGKMESLEVWSDAKDLFKRFQNAMFYCGVRTSKDHIIIIIIVTLTPSGFSQIRTIKRSRTAGNQGQSNFFFILTCFGHFSGTYANWQTVHAIRARRQRASDLKNRRRKCSASISAIGPPAALVANNGRYSTNVTFHGHLNVVM